MRTQVAIIGAGPAGLLLGHILHRAGIQFVILEQKSREYILGRIRAGVLEQGSVDILHELGLDSDLAERGLTHHGIYLQYEGQRHHIDFLDLVGRTVTIYGQQALVKHLRANTSQPSVGCEGPDWLGSVREGAFEVLPSPLPYRDASAFG